MKRLFIVGVWVVLTAHTSKTYKATFYHDMFHGRPTRSGEIFDQNKLTCAATPDFPFGTKLKVTNLENNKSVIVKVNDRGDFTTVDLDLSKKAFKSISILERGVINIKISKLN